MSEEFLIVKIGDANGLLEARRCRIVHLADGVRAALWRGLVWPLGDDDTIDVAGPAFGLLSENSPSALGFGIIEADEEAWLVLDGPVAVRDAAVGALQRAGITILRSGPWLGDAVDGVAGTGFIRFIRPSANDLREAIAKILQQSVNPTSRRTDPAERIRALTVELLETRAALARSGAEPREASSETGMELSRLQQENAALLQENLDLRQQFAASVAVRQDASLPAGRLHNEIALFLTSFRPDLRFLRDSLTVVSAEFADRRGCYRALLELGPEALGRLWKKIQGAPSWWERHISNGRDDSGRIYVRRAERSWDVLVSHKSQQSRDVAWLARR